MSKKNLICVFGATGRQGGSVAQALIDEGFSVRGITRSAADPKALKLKEKGVELVELDWTKASIPEISQAMWNCYGAFLMTTFDMASPNGEEQLGIKLVEAAQKANLKHIMWSSLPNVKKLSGGKLNVPQFTNKANVAEFIQNLQAAKTKAFQYTTCVAPAYFYQNFKGNAKEEGDTTVFTIPETRCITACDVTEIGPAVACAFKEPTKFDGKCIEYWGEHVHPQCYVDTFTRVTGKKAKLNLVPIDEFKKAHPEMAAVADMYTWIDECSFYGPDGAPFALHSGQMNTKGGLSNWSLYLQHGNWK